MLSHPRPDPARLKARRAHIDTYQAPVVYLRKDCEVCRAEGFEAQSLIELSHGGRHVVATVHQVDADWLAPGEAALSDAAWEQLGAAEGAALAVRHAPLRESMRHIRGKVFDVPLDDAKLRLIMQDVVDHRLSDLQLAAFVTTCAGTRMSLAETIALTRAMVDVGQRLHWAQGPVMDKHCVGGLPGNRTTLVVVPIVAACGLLMPKTSSRAITSPAGSADTMETLAPVNLDVATLRRVVEREGGCIAWGGSAQLSPADDILIRVERPLDIDGTAQLVASVLSEKAAVGAQQVLIDIPVGPTAKLRSAAAATALGETLRKVGEVIGLSLRVVQTDGHQPVGHGIGPALEALDVLAVLQGRPEAPPDLRQRSLRLAGELLEMGGKAAQGQGAALAQATLDSGQAWAKFQAICEAQGGLREPPRAPCQRVVTAPEGGLVAFIDNRRLATAAKLAGAPHAPAAGLVLQARLGDRVEKGQPLFTLHAQTPGELDYASVYVADHPGLVAIGSGQ